MNEETPVAGPSTAPDATAREPANPPTEPEAVKKRRLPGWLPLLGLAVVPAVIVGLAVFFIARGSGARDTGPGIIDGFFRLGPSSNDTIESYSGRLPPDFPSQFPIYKGARTIAGFVVNPQPPVPNQTPTQTQQSQGRSYFVILSTPATPQQVYEFYLDALTKDPWQVEVARSSTEFTGVQFTRPDDPDVQGDVSVHRSELDNLTSIYVSFQDLTPERSSATPVTKPFQPGASKPLPPSFPSDIPIYKQSDSVVTDTYFQRDPGSTSYIISFLTKDSGNDVVDFYKAEYEKRGWTVTNSATGNTGFGIAIDFNDGARQTVQGTLRTDTFRNDRSYTKVDLLLQLSTSRSRGN